MGSSNQTKKETIWNRNFTMVVLGQIISLFGNAILRFALPLYLLNETGSAALFGVVSACAFIPMIVLSPVGGIFADRVNKRNIMVVLDFSTADFDAFTLSSIGVQLCSKYHLSKGKSLMAYIAEAPESNVLKFKLTS